MVGTQVLGGKESQFRYQHQDRENDDVATVPATRAEFVGCGHIRRRRAGRHQRSLPVSVTESNPVGRDGIPVCAVDMFSLLLRCRGTRLRSRLEPSPDARSAKCG